MSDARLPINHWDTGKVSRDKINDSFNDVVNTVASYRPHIEAWYWWIWDTNTWVKAQWDSIDMKVEDWYIWYKSESADWTQIIAIEDLKWDKWDTWNWIASIVATKVWKTTTVTITDTEGHVESFPIQDWENWQMTWPASSVDWHIAVFDWTSGTSLRDWWPVPEWNVKSFTLSSTSDLTNAQAAYDWYDDGNVAIIVYNDKEYLFDYATENNAYWCAANESAYDTTSATWIQRASLQLALSSGTVTTITTLNLSVNDFKVLRTDKNYGTPYTPQYNWSPATKKYVDDKFADLMALGKFLSLWDCTTWLPISFPLTTPYTFHTGDYFMVEVIDTWDTPTNYRPNWSSYTWTASSTAETDEVAVWDFYVYDGSVWLLATNHWKAVSFANLAGSPSDNTALDNALDAKQDALTLPATPTQWHLVTWGADNETLVDGWAVPTWFTPWGTATTGYVVTKTASGYEWAAPTGWIQLAPNSTYTIKYHWYGTQAEYEALNQYYTDSANDTAYFTV